MVGIHVPNIVTYLKATQGLGHEHDPALFALLYLPIAVFMVMFAIEAGHHAGVAAAVRMRAGYMALGSASRLALLLIAMSAWVHIALAPTHWEEDHLRAILFVGLAVALGAVALGAFVSAGWRPAAALLLFASLFAYAFYVLSGREGLDPIGIFTKVVEATALVLVVAGQRADLQSAIPGSRPGITHTEVNPQ